MFEDSLMESQGRLSSPTQRWTTLVSITLQSSIVTIVIAIPLLKPETLPFHTNAPKVTLPLKPVPQVIPHAEDSSTTASSPTASTTNTVSLHSSIFTKPLGEISNEVPSASSAAMNDLNQLSNILGSTTEQRVHVNIIPARPPTRGLLHVSTGVSHGLLLAPIRPIYPHIAVLTRVEGVVIVEAIVSKSGAIESVRSTSGPEMLRSAAVDAVRNARYSPYLLNGVPTEVETTVTVTFRLAS